MSNPSYDLDDILNEITKRREENEQKVKADVKAENEESNNPVKEEINSQEEETPEVEMADEEETVEAEEISEEITEETVEAQEPEYTENDDEQQEEEPIQTEQEQVVQEEEIEYTLENADEIFEKKGNEGSVNLFELADQDYPSAKNRKKANKNKKKWIKTGKGKAFISIIMVLVLAIAGTGIYGFWFINNTLNKITVDSNNTSDEETKTEDWKGMDTLVEDFTPINEASKSTVSSYRDMVKKWYYNGNPASSTNVLNVLLIGEDTRGDEIEDSGTRADSAIIASVNTQTGEIVLTSILRDSYAYWETKIGDESTGKFGKITEAMASGVNCYINCVENLFKVNIDNYVIVNFASFKKIIDSLGGVNITMTKAEINEINNHPGTYGKVTISGDAGEKLLNGEQALAYCRIRHIDSDTVRADRQKTVLQQLFKKASQSSTLKMAEVVTDLLPYVKTGFSKSEILSIGKYALSHGWLGYSMVTYTVPSNETKPDGTVVTTCKGGQFGKGFYNNLWIWKVDYPLASQVLQDKIYDKTNVVLAENRPSFNSLSAY